MRKLFILLALLSAFVSKAAFMSFTATNSIGNPDTNSFILTAISTPLAADGSFTTTGLRIRVFPNASGVVITNLAQNNWNASNQFFNFCFRVPLDTGPTIYPMGQNLLTAVAPGGIGPFVTLVITNAGTNGNISYNQITNGLGYVPLSNSILPALTNGFVGAGITNGLAGLDTVYNASNVIEGGLNLALTNVLPTNGAGVYSIGRNGWISTNYDPFGLALTIGANDTNNVTVTSNALQSQITQGGVTGTVLTNTVNASSNLLSTLFITNAFGTNWPIVIVTGQRIYIPTNFDTAGAALAIGAADTNFANFISNIVAQLSITNVYGTNTTLSVAGQRVYVNTNFDLLGAAASIGTANSNYTFSTSNSVMVNAQALTNQLATTNWVGKLFIPNINGFGTNLTLSDFASSAPDLLIAPNGGANGLYISNELVDLGINLSTGPEASVLFSESPWPTVASLGSNYLRLLYVGGNGGGSPFGTPGSTVGVLSNAWATNITGPGLVLVSNVVSGSVAATQGVTNAYRTNWPFDAVINQSLYYPTNWDTNGTAALLANAAMQSATNFGLSKFVQMLNGFATNLFLTGATATNLTVYNGQTTNVWSTNSPFTASTNFTVGTYPVIYQSTNLVAFISSGTTALTNAMYIWIPAVGCYSNQNNQGTITNNGTIWLCQDNTGSTLFNNTKLTGSWTVVNGTGAALSDYGAYLRGDGINIVGLLQTNGTIVSGPSNGIATLNGFGTNTFLTNAVFSWNLQGQPTNIASATLNFYTGAFGVDNAVANAGFGAAVLSGYSNSMDLAGGNSGVIAGGYGNRMTGSGTSFSVIGGGASNYMNASYGAVIAGGNSNLVSISSPYSVISGGLHNAILGAGGGGSTMTYCTIVGGNTNVMVPNGSKNASTILGGQNNYISASYSTAIGRNTIITNDNTLMWSDGTALNSTTNNQILFQASNGMAINTNNAGTNALEVFGNVDSAVGFTIKGVPVQTAGNFILQQNGNSTNQTAISAQVLQSTNFALAIGGGTNFYASTNVVWVYQAGSPPVTQGAYEWRDSLNIFTNISTGAIITNTGSAFNLQTNGVTLYSSSSGVINTSWGAVSGSGTASTRYGGYFLHDGIVDLGSLSATNLFSLISSAVTTILSNNIPFLGQTSTNTLDVSQTSGSDTAFAVGNPFLPVATFQKACSVSEGYSNCLFVIHVKSGTYNLQWPLYETNTSFSGASNNFPNYLLPGHKVQVICDPGVVMFANSVGGTSCSNGVVVINPINTNSWLDWSGGTLLFQAPDGSSSYPVFLWNATGSGGGKKPMANYIGLHGVSVLATNCEDIASIQFPTNFTVENCTWIDNFDSLIAANGTSANNCLFRNNFFVEFATALSPQAHGPHFTGGTVLAYGNVMDERPTNSALLNINGYNLSATVMTNYNDVVTSPTNAFLGLGVGGSILYAGPALSIASYTPYPTAGLIPLFTNQPLFTFCNSNVVVSGGYFTNTTGENGLLTVTATPAAVTGSMRFTNMVTAEWFQITNTAAPTQLSFMLAPNDFLLATQITGTVAINFSSLRPFGH